MGLFDALSVLAGGVPSPLVTVPFAMLGAAAEWVVASLAFSLLAVGFFVAAVVSVLRNVSLPRSDRLAALVEWLERRFPALRRFDVSGKVEPTVEERRRRLEERYVAGEIDEETFERELGRVLDADRSPSRTKSPSRTRRPRTERADIEVELELEDRP